MRESADVVSAPHAEQAARLDACVREGAAAPLPGLEIGAGFNTPGVIRWRLENRVYHHPEARLVRVNPQDPEGPEEIAARSLAVRAAAAETVAARAVGLLPGPTLRSN
ncbi:MAG: NAD-dependent protein deacetylase of SIR2 family [uncultured Gemmatimonadaceae bacterium]|uniref:NAD-dependent protein deacetylase of SIR2 family n=1 Tax=uncultured Gemmatimonadaceae bacterium TaxID=246130 RepID=A0A6J4KHS5_9BACT|nr:MAG: NAD-dependent protein deacetylase of SIR2 family [uncultured Gemmatimonadaceae bacterium]